MTNLLLLGLIVLICIISCIAASNNKESQGLMPSFIFIGVLSLILISFTAIDVLTNNILLAQAKANGETKVQAIQQEAVKLGLATFTTTPNGKEIIFQWVSKNPVEKPISTP